MIKQFASLIGFQSKTDFGRDNCREQRKIPHTENFLKAVGGKYTTAAAFVVLGLGMALPKLADIFLSPIPVPPRHRNRNQNDGARVQGGGKRYN